MFYFLNDQGVPLGLDDLVHEWLCVLLHAIPTLAKVREREHWPGKHWLAEIVAVASASPQGSPVAGVQGDLPPSSGAHGSMGLAREKLNLVAAGLLQNVVATIQSARASFTSEVYGAKQLSLSSCHSFKTY